MSVPLPSVWTPKVEVDWDGSGAYDGVYENVTADVAGDPGLAVDAGRDGARALNPPKVLSLDFELRNDTGRYSHESPNSPVYQLVTPGTTVRATFAYGALDRYTSHGAYTAHDPYDGRATATLATTRIDDVEQMTARGQQRVRLKTLGQTSALIGRAVTIPLQQNIRTDQAVALVLDAAGWPSTKRALSPGDTTLLYWWADERSAWDLIVELLASEGPGTCFEDGEGVFHFENRNYRAVTARSQSSQATFSDVGSYSTHSRYTEHTAYTERDYYDGRGPGLYFVDLQYAPGWKNLFARATYATKRRALAASAVVVWQYGAVLSLSPSQVLTLFVRPQDPFSGAITPTVTTDYVVSAGAVTVSMAASSGFLAILTLTAGAAGATIAGPAASPATGLQLRAQPLTVLSETIAASSIDVASSATAYLGVQTLSVAGWPEIDPAGAAAVCDTWVSRYRTQRPQVTITVRAGDIRHFEQVVQRQVSDRITIAERNSGLTADVWIESRRIVMAGAGGRQLAAVWGCELCDQLAGNVWDGSTALWDSARWAR